MLSLAYGACDTFHSGIYFGDDEYYCSVVCAGHKWYGVDITREDIADNFEAFVWEPAIVKLNALTAASEAASLILSVDETIKNPRSGASQPPAAMPGMGRGRGRPL